VLQLLLADASGEEFVLETLLNVIPALSGVLLSHCWGTEMDLVIDHPDGECLVIEVKRSVSRGFHQAHADLNPSHCFVVIPREGHLPLAPKVDAIGLNELATELAG